MRRPIPEAVYRTPLFLGLPQQYLVVWLAVLASAGIAVGSATHVALGLAAVVLGMASVHPALARACEEDPLALDVFFHWLLHEHPRSEPHPGLWDPTDRIRPSIPEP